MAIVDGLYCTKATGWQRVRDPLNIRENDFDRGLRSTSDRSIFELSGYKRIKIRMVSHVTPDRLPWTR